jgi:hypothetical protein
MFVLFCFEAICDRYLRTALNCLVDFIITLFPPCTNQISLLQICAYRKLHCDYRKLHCDYKKLHCDYKFCTAFDINCTEINQSQSSNIFMYIIRSKSDS